MGKQKIGEEENVFLSQSTYAKLIQASALP